jgi:hypothetical protein
MSREDLLFDLLEKMNMLEFTSATTSDDQYICYLEPDICTKSSLLDQLNESPSIDLSLSDPSVVQLLLSIKSGTSLKNIRHMAQLYTSLTFSLYDYSRCKNLELYASEMPPEIPLDFPTKTHLFVASNDEIGDI